MPREIGSAEVRKYSQGNGWPKGWIPRARARAYVYAICQRPRGNYLTRELEIHRGADIHPRKSIYNDTAGSFAPRLACLIEF